MWAIFNNTEYYRVQSWVFSELENPKRRGVFMFKIYREVFEKIINSNSMKFTR